LKQFNLLGDRRTIIALLMVAVSLCGCRSLFEDPPPPPDTSVPENRLRERFYSSDQHDQLMQVQAGQQLARSANGLAIVLRATKDERDDMRAAAAYGLAASDDPSAEAALIKLLDDPAEPVRLAALANLYGRKTARTVPAVKARLTAKEPDIRMTAVGILASFGDSANLHDIVPLAHDSSPMVRRVVYAVLPRYGAAAVPYLQAGTHDGSPELAKYATDQLDNLVHPKPKKPNPHPKLPRL
jgi:HEAT repeat protein